MRVENLAPYAQPEVHGLLGQRAIDPKPPVQALVEQPANSDKNELAALATTTLSAALDLGGAAASVTRLCSARAFYRWLSRFTCDALVPAGGVGAGTTVRAAVEADGRAQPLPPGLQGEGFIEGSYLDYKVSSMPPPAPPSTPLTAPSPCLRRRSRWSRRTGSVSSSTRASPAAPETRRELARASGDLDRMREEEKRTVRAVEIACLISCERVNAGENREVKWAYVVVWRDVRSEGIPP